ncbi:murein hydrolase activator EnvC family protein [Streptosporangium amethystogenes]|uniref:murein hydrolase activator EnvC family protein n=1 Tax=Streptosporangium amethystogenes TaxID=2002 RepID=UPI00068D0346|nr:peptidoglycan DD-metalloendopeptidase family protein [Streptosporangium amethystogenes]
MRPFPAMGLRAVLCSLILAVPAAGAHHATALASPGGGTGGGTGREATPGMAGATRPGEAPAPSPLWGWPLAGRPRVLRGFAPPAQPWLAGHRGADLAASPGAEVRAAGAGTVGYAGPLAERGVVTVLHPGGLRTTYLPVQPSVGRGRAVATGEVIGVLQDVPGHCPAACLHWGLLRDRAYLDPLLLLGHGQVRLLPLWPGRDLAGRPVHR